VSIVFLDDGLGTPAGFGLAVASGAIATAWATSSGTSPYDA
jgi:hypothetical protein